MLRRLGFRSGGLAELAALCRGERLSGRTAFLTFDDGFADNATTAMPLLAGYGFFPLVFLLPRHVERGAALDWPEVAAAQAQLPELMRSMGWTDVERMVAGGAQFGAHTLTHPHLPQLGDEQLREELAESRELVAARLGTCEAIAYPFGEWDERVARVAGEVGYSFAFSLPQGPQASGTPLSIPRVNVDRRDRGARFLVKLSAPGRRLLLSDAGERARGLRDRLRSGGGEEGG